MVNIRNSLFYIKLPLETLPKHGQCLSSVRLINAAPSQHIRKNFAVASYFFFLPLILHFNINFPIVECFVILHTALQVR